MLRRTKWPAFHWWIGIASIASAIVAHAAIPRYTYMVVDLSRPLPLGVPLQQQDNPLNMPLQQDSEPSAGALLLEYGLTPLQRPMDFGRHLMRVDRWTGSARLLPLPPVAADVHRAFSSRYGKRLTDDQAERILRQPDSLRRLGFATEWAIDRQGWSSVPSGLADASEAVELDASPSPRQEDQSGEP